MKLPKYVEAQTSIANTLIQSHDLSVHFLLIRPQIQIFLYNTTCFVEYLIPEKCVSSLNPRDMSKPTYCLVVCSVLTAKRLARTGTAYHIKDQLHDSQVTTSQVIKDGVHDTLLRTPPDSIYDHSRMR
jgi:hypothetical protein